MHTSFCRKVIISVYSHLISFIWLYKFFSIFLETIQQRLKYFNCTVCRLATGTVQTKGEAENPRVSLAENNPASEILTFIAKN